MLTRFGPATRKWLLELANIVLGVVIALALGAIVTWLGWRMDVGDARRSLRLEIGKIVVRSEERRRTGWCVERRLDALASAVDAAARTGQLAPIGDIGTPPVRTWSREL